MKKLLFLSILALAACRKKCEDPTPITPPNTELAPVAGPFTASGGVPVRLAVRDSATGQYFRPLMTCDVFFYPPQWTEAQVRTQAVFDRRLGWMMVPTLYWQRGTTEPSHWYPDNTVLLSILGQANAVILWRFTEADKARPRYSEYYQFCGVLKDPVRLEIVIDRKLAGI